MQLPQFDRPFILTTDASDFAQDKILYQGEIGFDLPIY